MGTPYYTPSLQDDAWERMAYPARAGGLVTVEDLDALDASRIASATPRRGVVAPSPEVARPAPAPAALDAPESVAATVQDQAQNRLR